MENGGGLDRMGSGILLVKSIINALNGGKFIIKSGHGKSGKPISNSLDSTPHSSGNSSFTMWPHQSYCGFVMRSTVQG